MPLTLSNSRKMKEVRGAMQGRRESSADTYAAWYPTVQRTLTCLSKLYRCVESRVFAGLAQDAVTSCTAAVQVQSSTQNQPLHQVP